MTMGSAIEEHTAVGKDSMGLDATPVQTLEFKDDLQDGQVISVAQEATGENLPDGYYKSFGFIGTVTALCLSGTALFMFLLMPSAVLTVINNDLGPSPLIAWWAIGRTAAQSITFTIIGRLSDIFGRRYFFVGGNAVALIGTAITASSQNIAQLAIGSAITGVGEAIQNSYNIALPELVKNKHRPMVLSLVFATSAPFAAFGSITSTAMIKNGMSWRWCFYIPMICVAISTALLYFCYHPPTYTQLHAAQSKTKRQQVAEIDYVGILLYFAALVLMLLPLSWGGSLFPWASATTIAPLLIGFFLLIGFLLWENYAKQPIPLVPVHLLKNRGVMTLVICATIGSCSYFPCILLWPQQVARIYGFTGTHAGWLACTVGGSTALGQIVAGAAIRLVGNSRWLVLASSVLVAAFIAALSALTPTNLSLGIALTILGPFFIGVIELAALSLAPLFCNPEDLGIAAGLLGTIRTFGASIATAIYSSILTTRLSTTIPAAVVPAAQQAGFDMTNIKALLLAARAGTLTKVPGITPEVIKAVAAVLPGAYAAAFKTVYLTSLAFGGIGILAASFSRDATRYLDGTVSRKLQGKTVRT